MEPAIVSDTTHLALVQSLVRDLQSLKRKFERHERRETVRETHVDHARLSDAQFSAENLPYFFIQYEMDQDEDETLYRSTSLDVKLPQSQYRLLGSPSSIRSLQEWYRQLCRMDPIDERALTAMESSALGQYTFNSFERFWEYFERSEGVSRVDIVRSRKSNALLANKSKHPEVKQRTETFIALCEAFDNIFNYSWLPYLKGGVRLYEGQGRNENDCIEMMHSGKLRVGTVIERKRPTSTSWHPNVALDFARSQRAGSNGLVCIYEIAFGSSVRGVPVELFQCAIQPEMEIILQPNIRLELLSYEKDAKIEARSLTRVATLADIAFGPVDILHFRVHSTPMER